MSVSVLDACVLYPPALRDLFMWLAAAIEANASVIVTFNLSDFPNSALKPYHVRAVLPDKYLVGLLEDAADLFIMGVRDHRASLKRPPKTVEEYLETLKINGLIRLTQRLAEYGETI